MSRWLNGGVCMCGRRRERRMGEWTVVCVNEEYMYGWVDGGWMNGWMDGGDG